MKSGDRIKLDQKVKMTNITYKVGHEFTLTTCDDIRGWDMVDDEGHILCETRFVKFSLVK